MIFLTVTAVPTGSNTGRMVMREQKVGRFLDNGRKVFGNKPHSTYLRATRYGHTESLRTVVRLNDFLPPERPNKRY